MTASRRRFGITLALLGFASILPAAVRAQPPVYLAQWGSGGSGPGQFSQPQGVATDAAGNVYVADGYNARIQKFTGTGVFITQWGTAGSGNGQFNYPWAVATDAAGNVYVADSQNNRIQKFTGTGTYLTQWGGFFWPRGVATDASGNVYVADTFQQRIAKFTSTGTLITQWGSFGSGNGQFNSPHAVATDAAGNVYVAEAEGPNQRIQKFTSTGTYITQWGSPGNGNGQFNDPYGLGTDAAGNVYVPDTRNHRVQKFTSTGTYLTQWGTPGNGNGEFIHPVSVATDTAGHVYVLDQGNARIQKFGDTSNCPAVTISPDSLPGGTVKQPYQQVLTPTGGTPPYAFSVTGGSLPRGIQLSGSGLISGSPVVAGSFSFTVGVTDADGCPGSKDYKIDLICPPVTISPPSLPAATVRDSFSAQLAADGSPPFVFVVEAGSLPPGLTLTSYGWLTGSPGTTGSFPFTVGVIDSSGCRGTIDYKLDVSCGVVAILPASLPNAPLGEPYLVVLTADGNPPFVFDVKGGGLPPGLTLDPGGALSGTPTATGSFGFTIGVTDSNLCRGTRDYKVTVLICPPIAISPSSLPAGAVKQPYHEVLTPSDGTPPFVFEVKAGSLPPGLRLSGSGTTLYGCHPGGGIFTVDLASGAGTTTGVFAPTGSVTEIEHDFLSGATFAQGSDGSFFGQRFDILSGAPIGGPVNDGGSFQGLEYVGSTLYGTYITNAGGPSTLSILDPNTGGSSPIGSTGTGPISGLAHDAGSGIMYGISGGGRFSPGTLFTIDLGTGAATAVGPTGMTAGSLEFGPDGNLYAGGDGQDGGHLYRIDRLTGAATLVGETGYFSVSGLTLGPGGAGATGLISGIPTAGGSFAFTVSVTDANGCRGSIDYKIDLSCPAITLSPTSLPPGQVKDPYEQALTPSGGSPPYVYSVASGSLPPGLGIHADSTGNALISGILVAEGNFTFTIHVTDNNSCSGDQQYTIAVTCPAITVNPSALPNGVTMMPYSQILTPKVGSPPFTVELTSGSLPPGLSLKEQPLAFAADRGRFGSRAVAARSAAGSAAPRAAWGGPLTGASAAGGPIASSLTVASDSTKGPRILFALADNDDPAYRGQIASLIGGTVDFFQCAGAFGGTTPSPELLATYDCVFTKPNYTYADRVLLGDRLADYVDAGGKVILGVFCSIDDTQYPGFALQGRIMTPDYCPVAVIPGTSFFGRADYAGDGTTCIHAGVAGYGGDLHEQLALQGAGAADGHYTQDGSIAHAYRPDGRVIYSNGHGGFGYGATGDWALLIANACACDPHPIQIVISGTPTETGTFNFTLRFTDRNQCSGEQDFTIRIVDQSTPTLLSLFLARPVDQGLELRWQFGDPRTFSSVGLERSAAALGPWMPLADERREENSVTVALDRDVVPGQAYYYRLVATTAAGEKTIFGPLSGTAGLAISGFGLERLAPNPSAGDMRIDFTVPRAAIVRLSVLDVLGREVAVLVNGLRPPGRYQATWSGEGARGPVPAGLYFVQYRTPNGNRMKRAVITR